jgi:hypothetical protein
MTDEQARMFATADNKLFEGGERNTDALRIEFDEIALAAPGIDLGSSGFTIGERDVIVGRHRTDQLGPTGWLPSHARWLCSIASVASWDRVYPMC